MDYQALKKLENVDICSVSKEELVNLRNVKINLEERREERIKEFLTQVKNPYCFVCDGIIVKMRFSDCNETLEDKLADYFNSL